MRTRDTADRLSASLVEWTKIFDYNILNLYKALVLLLVVMLPTLSIMCYIMLHTQIPDTVKYDTK